MNIIFAGTPQFAVPTLDALIRSRHQVELVVTQPDRSAGRGRKPVAPPVKEWALSAGLSIVQPESINRAPVVDRIRRLGPDALVVVAYGKRLGRRVLELPRLGCFNIHASLLPRHRGASPINYAISSGDRETGITIQKMATRIDSGPIVAQRATAIGEQETSGELSERLAELAREMIVPVLDSVQEATVREQPQDDACATYAPRLRKADGFIPWGKDSSYICRFVRAMTPWPGAFTLHQTAPGRQRGRLIVLAARTLAHPGYEARHACDSVARPGVIVRADDALVVAAGEGFVSLLQVKPEAGKAMDAAAFLRGHTVRAGDRFRGRP